MDAWENAARRGMTVAETAFRTTELGKIIKEAK